MAAPVLSVSSDVSVESVRSSFSRVILIGSISVKVPVAPEVGAAAVASPAGSDTKIPERHVSPTPHDTMLTRWMSRAALRSSSPITSIPEIPTALILPAPSAIVILYPDMHNQTPPTVIHLHHRDFFIHRLLGLHGVVRPISVGGLLHYLLFPSRTDLLPPHKRDSISPEDSVEEDIDTDVLEDFEADATTVEVVVDRDVKIGIDVGIGMEVNVGIDVEDEVESSDRGIIEVGLDVVAGIGIPDAMLMPDAVERLEQNMTITRSGMTSKTIEELVNRRVEEVLTAYEATRATNALEAKKQSQNSSGDDNGNGGNRNGENRNGENGNGGNGNQNENDRGARPIIRTRI
uniref:Uncharacterized protein n=1 Tax=Tanacetum cinerariifolium TaxID=118510 RepID=A0A6L2JSB7_TANCI|nr:hypothetical protein [Tanacetum cinerariifolium]